MFDGQNKMLKLEQLQFLGQAIYHLSFVSAGECCWSLSLVERKHVERKFSGICGAESGHNIEHLGVKRNQSTFSNV
jgi:hypothetical protein